MHFVGRFDGSRLTPAGPRYQTHSEGYSIAPLIDHSAGSVHTELTVNQLNPRGTISPHVHSYEEGFYILAGRAEVSINGNSHLPGPGDYGEIKLGTEHSCRNAGSEPVRWLQMAAPQPKTTGDVKDTFYLKDGRIPTEGNSPDLKNPKGSMLGHFDMSRIPPMAERQDVMKGLEGVFLNRLIDSKLGASHHRMAFMEYQPGVGIGPHDHTFEESCFVVSGEIEGVLDVQPNLAKAGDFLWTGVGCVHSFQNKSAQPVRWLETFSPQPPSENAFRFMAEWQKRAVEIEG